MKVQNLSPSSEIVCIVNANDEIVKTTSRKEMREQGLLHRVTYLLVFNSCGQILVQTRTKTKDWYPGYFDLAAGGVMTSGESYEESAQRELLEELGINDPIKYEFKIYFEDNCLSPVTHSWGAVYSCTSEGPFILQPEEVADVSFMSVEDALKIPRGKITPDTRQVLVAYLMER